MLRHMRLYKDRALFGVEARCQKVKRHINRVLLDLAWIGVVSGKCVKVGDKEKALVLILQTYPILERPHVVAEVQFTGGPHAAEHTLFDWFRGFGQGRLHAIESLPLLYEAAARAKAARDSRHPAQEPQKS